jgi:DNA polymerase-3 subunit alpha
MGEGQLDWFSVMDSSSDGETELLNENCPDFEQSEKLASEYEYAGMYFSGHPLDNYRLKIQAFSDCTAAQICDTPEFDGKRISICGRITALSSRRTKSGRFLTSMILSDFSGECPVIAFESSMQQYKSVVNDGAAVCMTANISFSDEEKGAELIMVSAVPLENLQIGEDKSLYIRVESKNAFEKLKPVFKNYPGKSNLCVYFSDTSTLVCSDSANRILISDELGEMLIEKLGESNVKIK